MSYTKVKQSDGANGFPARARDVSAAAGQTAAQLTHGLGHGLGTAGQGIGSTAQSVNAHLQAAARSGTRGARNWAAPRLESAADFTTATAAPAVSGMLTNSVAPWLAAALRSTAQQVSLDASPRRSRGIRPVLAWSALTAAVLAGTGAVAALVLRRCRTAMTAGTESDAEAAAHAGGEAEAAGEPVSEDTGPRDDQQSQGTVPGGETTVNGRVSAPGR